MNINNLFSRKEYCHTEEKEVKVTYGFTQYGLEQISKIDFEKLFHYGWNSYDLLREMDADLQYLLGVADSLPNNQRVRDIVERFSQFRDLVDLPSYIEGVKAEYGQ
jgi:phage major head subunit gpT-like protein